MGRSFRDFASTSKVFIILIFVISFAIFILLQIICMKLGKKMVKSADAKVTTTTPVSLLEVKVTLPTKVIFGEIKTSAQKYDPHELTQTPKVRLGEGTLGTLFKVVLNCGSIFTVRKIREGPVRADDLEFWIKFFGGISDPWLSPIQFSYWHGGEAFVLYEYFCLGSLEELLHGSEGIKYTPLSCGIRKQIALCAAKALAFIHTQKTKNGEPLVCGVIKASNVLIRVDFSTCLSGYETPYLVSPATIIRRNLGRVAPELRTTQNCNKVFTKESDVYSFGVLLLEMITGKRPTMTNLVEYILEKRKKEGLNGIYDKRMGELNSLENMVELVEVARLCLSRNPKERPSMDRVVQMIQGFHE